MTETTLTKILLEGDLEPADEFEGNGENPCFLCGRETRGERFVHLHVDYYLVPFETDLGDESQGWFPIGPECAKKLPAEFVGSAT